MRVPHNARRVGSLIILDPTPEEINITKLKEKNKILESRLNRLESIIESLV